VHEPSDPGHPLVSIVTPVHNGAAYLQPLIESVLAQSYDNIEHVVIDDGSTDGGATVAILRKYPRLRWWSRENKGQYETLNEGFRAARGDIVTTISADDFYVDGGAIRDVVERFRTRPDVDVVFGGTVLVDQAGTPWPVQSHQDYPLWYLAYNLFIAHCSLFVRTNRIRERSLFFDPSYRYRGDADWTLRLYRAGLSFSRLPRPIAAYRHHPLQASRQPSHDAEARARQASERRRFREQHALHGSLQRLVDWDVAWQNQWRRVKYEYRSGGLSRLAAKGWKRALRRLGRP
jgi:glycosyltransferase involved in cell wall biosynthesis